MKKIGIEHYDKIITYTCNSIKGFPDEHLFISHLIELVQQKLFGNVVLVIRLHPKYRREEYKSLFQHQRDVILDTPDSSFAAGEVKSSEIKNGIEDFVNLMKHSDVVINLASTTTIDAAVFDTPIINIAYNNNLSHDAWNAAAKWYTTTHYQDIVNTNGTKIAKSEDDLIKYIIDYLENPAIDKEGRKKIVDEQCYKIDGNSHNRIIKAICDIVD